MSGMMFAYADPPYLGCCALYEHSHGADGRCWDEPDTHGALIDRLVDEYPDGWAMSATSGSLRTLLPMCPADVRVGAWAKSFCAFKKGVRPAYAWEPVIFWRGRNPGAGHAHAPPTKGGAQTTPKDFIVEPITMRRGFTGAKPEPVIWWVLDLLNAQPGDKVVDLFHGSGAAAEAIDAYFRRDTYRAESLFGDAS